MAIEARRGDFDMAPAAIYRDEAAIELEVASGIPWHAGRALSPALAAKLPTLPEELEYRLVDRQLLLRDRDANLVIDVLSGTAPATK